VAKLQERLPNCVSWSNGNIFRSLTLLAVTWCELFNLPEFSADAALADANLAGFMKMLSFGKFNGKWDIRVKGLGLDFLVSEVSNTLLKEPKVGKHIPTVAERTQGEVVNFAATATGLMGADGILVLLEGRQQTVDYVPSPLRYTLTMSDTTLLGQRRAAQRLAAGTLKALPLPQPVPVEVTAAEEGSGGSRVSSVEARVEEPSERLILETLHCKLDELAYEANVEVELDEWLVLDLAVGETMGLTVREIEPDNFLLVTGVEPGSQGCAKGARIGYFLREIDGEEVASLDEVFSALKAARDAGAKSFSLALSALPPVPVQGEEDGEEEEEVNNGEEHDYGDGANSDRDDDASFTEEGGPMSPISELEGTKRGSSLGRAATEASAVAASAQTASPVRPLVVCGPSGVGKGTLIGKVLDAFPGLFGFSVSHTTRAPRPGETNGVDYHFVAKPDMEAAIARGEFLESAGVHGNFYGTSYRAVGDVMAAGKVCILDIDVQGCRSVKAAAAGGALATLPRFLFIAPPTMEDLEVRLTGRGTETKEKIALRLGAAKEEVAYGLGEGNMDAIIINDDVGVAYGELVDTLASWYPSVARALGDDVDGGGADSSGGSPGGGGGAPKAQGESPSAFLQRVGLGAYVEAFAKFGVESVEDIATSARLLTDEELKAELGMGEAAVAAFREIFGGGEEEEDSDGEENEGSYDSEADDL